MIVPNDNSGRDANDDRIDGDNSDGKTNDGADGHRNDEEMLFFQMKIYCTTTNLALEQIIQ